MKVSKLITMLQRYDQDSLVVTNNGYAVVLGVVAFHPDGNGSNSPEIELEVQDYEDFVESFNDDDSEDLDSDHNNDTTDQEPGETEEEVKFRKYRHLLAEGWSDTDATKAIYHG